MLHLENNTLKISILSKGAELRSVFHKQNGLEYMWDANPAFWSKTSPVLFPIVGQLKDNIYKHEGKEYHLSRHGFAREKEFEVIEKAQSSATFSLQSNEDTLAIYPFHFLFNIIYSLQDDEPAVQYRIQNKGEKEMLFSVGGHPAFKLPLVEGTAYHDYGLSFNREETAGRWPITKDGIIGSIPEPLLNKTTVLPLTKDLFKSDAVVLKHLDSDEVTLGSDKTSRGLRFVFHGFPYLGLWAAPGADFVCIEPWCGIADSVNADGELAHKEGINKLPPGETFSVAWQVRFY